MGHVGRLVALFSLKLSRCALIFLLHNTLRPVPLADKHEDN
jgi:hypothetical protein